MDDPARKRSRWDWTGTQQAFAILFGVALVVNFPVGGSFSLGGIILWILILIFAYLWIMVLVPWIFGPNSFNWDWKSAGAHASQLDAVRRNAHDRPERRPK